MWQYYYCKLHNSICSIKPAFKADLFKGSHLLTVTVCILRPSGESNVFRSNTVIFKYPIPKWYMPFL